MVHRGLDTASNKDYEEKNNNKKTNGNYKRKSQKRRQVAGRREHFTLIVHTRQWFRNRIGKTIYREKLRCPCAVCQNMAVHIHDYTGDKTVRGNKYFHADYVFDAQHDLRIEYFDKPIKGGKADGQPK